jgi:hypothetical protein
MANESVFRKGIISLGGVTLPYVLKTSTYTIGVDNYILGCSGTFSIALPSANSITGKHYILKNIGNGVVSVGTTSSQTIDDLPSYTLEKYDSVTLFSNGSNWSVISKEVTSIRETIVTDAGISRTLAISDSNTTIVFTGANPVALTLPTDASVFLPIGFKVKVTQQGAGIVTSSTAGISAISDCGFSSAVGETRTFVKTDINTWSIEGNRSRINATFTGTTTLPSTTSIGSITSTIIGFLSGITSNVQNQLNTKLTVVSGVTNYIQKVTGVNILGNTRIYDNGSYIGIDTTTPTKDITLGKQSDREIGVEESDNTYAGKSLRSSAGRAINYISNANFNLLSQVTNRAYRHIKGHPNGDVYAVSGGDLYRQTNAVGEFNLLTTGISGIRGLFITSTSDIYVCVYGGYCYKQTNSTGSYVQFGQIGNWEGMAVYNNIDVYAITGWGPGSAAGYIYKQTGGVGNLVAIDIQRDWNSIDVAQTGVFATSWTSGVYFQNSGAGSFDIIRAGNAVYLSIDNANNLYLNEYSGQYHIYKRTNLIGIFVDIFVGNADLWFRGIGFDKNNNVYVASYQNTIWYKQTYAIGAPDLDGGTYKTFAGTGKGTGKSWWQAWTGQKTVSGTDMQIETLRIQANEVGEVILPSTTIAIIDAETTGKQVVTKEWVDAKVGGLTSVSIRYETTWISGSQQFTVPSDYLSVINVIVQGASLSDSQYSLQLPDKVTILDTLNTNDYVIIIYGSTVVLNADPLQIIITTSVSITTDTLGDLGKTQKGKNIIINNGANAINITVNGGTNFNSSYFKGGSGVITFLAGSGRTLVQTDGTNVFNGIVGSTAIVTSFGTVDYLRISNA